MMKRKPTLAQLQADYDWELKKPDPSLAKLRRLRDQIIKIKFDLGLI